MKLRIRFKKTGAMRYIGHLDVLRFFQKVMRRADIDIKYTTGFSPHQVMSFAQPLSVGIESTGEYMDIEVNSYEGESEFLRKVNAASVSELCCTSVRILPENAENAMASVKAAEYLAFIREDKLNYDFLNICSDSDKRNSLSLMISEFMSRETILIEKEGKKGNRLVDIRPGIFSLECIKDNAHNSGEICFNMLLDASSGGNVKPVQVLSEFYRDAAKESLPQNTLRIKRLDMFALRKEGDLSGENDDISINNLISLGDIGFKTIEEYEAG